MEYYINKQEWLSVDRRLLLSLEQFCDVHGYPSIMRRISELN